MASKKRPVQIKSVSKFTRPNPEDNENITFNSEGYIEENGDQIKIKYPEVGEGMDKTVYSTIAFSKTNRHEATITRSGSESEMLFFTPGGRYNGTHSTLFGDIDICTNTLSMKNNIDYSAGGKIDVHYTVESCGVEFQKVHLSVQVK